jgi:hypothetical protein
VPERNASAREPVPAGVPGRRTGLVREEPDLKNVRPPASLNKPHSVSFTKIVCALKKCLTACLLWEQYRRQAVGTTAIGRHDKSFLVFPVPQIQGPLRAHPDPSCQQTGSVGNGFGNGINSFPGVGHMASRIMNEGDQDEKPGNASSPNPE